nr:hypothetical protein [Limnobacter sp. SAORIC-690]
MQLPCLHHAQIPAAIALLNHLFWGCAKTHANGKLVTWLAWVGDPQPNLSQFKLISNSHLGFIQTLHHQVFAQKSPGQIGVQVFLLAARFPKLIVLSGHHVHGLV